MTSKPGRAGGKGLALATTGPIVAAVLLLAGLIFPLVITNETATQIAVDTLLYVAAAVAWNLFSGFSGYISLGHAVFFGVGAYTVGIAARDWHVTGDLEFALLPLAGLAAGLVAVPFGLIALLAWLIYHSRFGLQLRAIRDDEDRARGLGVRAMRVKLSAFVISGVVTGLVGAIWFFFIGQVLPQYGFDPLFDLSVALMTFFGGFGTLWGPVLGALVLEPGEQFLTLRVSNSYVGELIWGSLFLLVILFMSRGVLPIAWENLTAWRSMPGIAVAA